MTGSTDDKQSQRAMKRFLLATVATITLAAGAHAQSVQTIECTVRDQVRRGGIDINWEDPHPYCSHSGGRIESAYVEDDAP